MAEEKNICLEIEWKKQEAARLEMEKRAREEALRAQRQEELQAKIANAQKKRSTKIIRNNRRKSPENVLY